MRPTKSPLNQGIRWPYLNQPCPVRKSGGWLLTNHFTSFTSEAPTVHVRGSYHRERSHYSCPRFTLRPGPARFARSPPTLLIYREHEADYEFHSSPSLGDPQLIGLPPRTVLQPRVPPSGLFISSTLEDTSARSTSTSRCRGSQHSC